MAEATVDRVGAAGQPQPALPEDRADRPLRVLILALGGEGGGTLTEWLYEAARASGFPVQATSIPGVAQRTGATSYYLELLPRPVAAGAPAPVMCLAPLAGDLDLVVSSELLETARAIERGLVDPQRTTLVSSSSRFLTVAEKMHMGDGRFDQGRAAELARRFAHRAVLIDMTGIARRQGTVVSAVMLGAIAASGVCGIGRSRFEQVVRASGGSRAEASLRGFAAGFDAVLAAAEGGGNAVEAAVGDRRTQAAERGSRTETAEGSNRPQAAEVANRTGAEAAGRQREPAAPPASTPETGAAGLPAEVADLADVGAARLAEYQDAAYASEYRDRIERFVALETAAGGAPEFAASRPAARFLALWMAYEDVARVAELKSRPERFERIRTEVGARPDEPIVVRDFLKPGVEEIAAMLPQRWARRLERWARRRRIGAI
ncbi:MAG: indolepyruvate oxidoreductase subunit beta family protein, partial [Burkholderiales bacterium]